MADFYPVLSRAVGALPLNTAETRRAIYERARGALLGQLKSIQPPMSEADLARQSDALSLAAARIEAEYDAAARALEAELQPLPEPEFALLPVEPPAPPAYKPLPLTFPPREADGRDDSKPEPLASEAGASGRGEPDAGWDEPVAVPHGPDKPATDVSPAVSEPATVRPRVSTPPKPVDASGRRRTLIVGGGVGLAVLGIAIAAYVVNSGPQPAVNGKPPVPGLEQRTAADGRGGKLGERVGQDGQPSTSPSTNPSNRPELPVAQRAVLYVESQDDPQKPVAVGGRVAWRLDSENVGQGRPVETVVRATVEVPESGLTLTFTIRRNTDAAFPASHILGMRFVRSGDDGNGAVKEAGVPQFKSDENERGAPLSAITSSLGDNLFVSALSNVPVEIERNVELMTRRNWVDIPVRFASGKRGIIAFEKGFSGDQTITDAFNRWR